MTDQNIAELRADYARRVSEGEGYVPGQTHDQLGGSPAEREFRASIERRKDDILARRAPVAHPVTLTDEQVEIARRNIKTAPWARQRFDDLMAIAEHVAAQPAGYVEAMISELTPTSPYGFTCPACVGTLSQEGSGFPLFEWDHKRPDEIRCKACGQRYPDARYPEEGVLILPRSGQTITYYLTPAERADRGDRSGALAYKWVEKPTLVSFEGILREMRAKFMLGAANRLGIAYRMTGEARFALRGVEILARLAHAMPRWLYHDAYSTFADCDPIYAAWHDMALPLHWKRNPYGQAYAGPAFETGPVDDQPDCAKMLAYFFCAGRCHPSADTSLINPVAGAYDLLHDATDADGRSLWTPELRRKLERDLILEWIMTGEPFVGGADRADCINNKGPYVYHPMAQVARCMGIADFADVALRGYEALRDKSFLSDGFSHESPAYTVMFISGMVWIPETLHGFAWPAGFKDRSGVIDVFKTDARLRRILRTQVEQLRPDGRYLPLADSPVNGAPSLHVFEIAMRRCPGLVDGCLPAVLRAIATPADNSNGPRTGPALRPSEYTLFNLPAERAELDLPLPLSDTLFPDWLTAVLRNGSGPRSDTLAFTFSPPGIHRQTDNLHIYFAAQGRDLLGDQGYVCDTPMNHWIHAIHSHNLVIVDGGEQVFWKGWGRDESDAVRRPGLRRMASTPFASVVEAYSDAYPQCPVYRRFIALVKTPGGGSFVIDIFRVTGGRQHVYRLSSEVGASNAPGHALTFEGIAMPPLPPYPDFGKSIVHEHIFGLRDSQRVAAPAQPWSATWSETGFAFRTHVLCNADTAEVSNGPGQETLSQSGRRLRFLDLVRGGENVSSTFVTVHEAPDQNGKLQGLKPRRLAIPVSAGPDAVAIEIESPHGRYLFLNQFAHPATVAGVEFHGDTALLLHTKNGAKALTIAAKRCRWEGGGFADGPDQWTGRVIEAGNDSITADAPPPAGFPTVRPDVKCWFVTGDGPSPTGYEVDAIDGRRIASTRFPIRPMQRFTLPAVRLIE
ncbi:MAG: heparinase II/III-family protein [Planctomycetes bacterium]|nr:heparinase II/III-family protein [Planctomycetota bacterium]